MDSRLESSGDKGKIGKNMFKSLMKRRILPLTLSAEVTGDNSFEIALQLFLFEL